MSNWYAKGNRIAVGGTVASIAAYTTPAGEKGLKPCHCFRFVPFQLPPLMYRGLGRSFERGVARSKFSRVKTEYKKGKSRGDVVERLSLIGHIGSNGYNGGALGLFENIYGRAQVSTKPKPPPAHPLPLSGDTS